MVKSWGREGGSQFELAEKWGIPSDWMYPSARSQYGAVLGSDEAKVPGEASEAIGKLREELAGNVESGGGSSSSAGDGFFEEEPVHMREWHWHR